MSDQEPDKQQEFLLRLERELREVLGKDLILETAAEQAGEQATQELGEDLDRFGKESGLGWGWLLDLLEQREKEREQDLLATREGREGLAGLDLPDLLTLIEGQDEQARLEGLQELFDRLGGPDGASRRELREMREQPELHKRFKKIIVGSMTGSRSSVQPSEDGSTASISLYFDLDNFGPRDIVDIIGVLSELYVDIGGDGLIIDDVTLLDFQPAIVPVEV